MFYGYIRAGAPSQTSNKNSLEDQKTELKNAGAEKIYSDTFKGSVNDHPQLDKLLSVVTEGDIIVVTSLDRIATSMKQALELIDTLGSRGVKVYVLNLGLLDDSPIGKLIKNILTTTAECERDMRMQRTAEGKQAAKKTSGYREGRPPKYSDEDLKSALKFLKTHTFTEVTEMTGISRSTLVRLKKKS